MVEKGVSEPCSTMSITEDNKTDVPSVVELSKRQQKRFAKRQKWLLEKPLRREKEKMKRKKHKAENVSVTPDLHATDDRTAPSPAKRSKTVKLMSESSCRIRIAIDTAYDHLMNESEISKTCKQIQRCYSSNRRVENPLQVFITNYSSQSMHKLASIGCNQWDVFRESRKCNECFKKEEIVYLTSESPNVLDKLDESNVYIIGGLVDHNKHKGLCLSIAEENGFQHARLPIEEFISMKTRKVLSIVHVFEILLNVAHDKTWSDALIQCLPQRKLPALIEDKKTSEKKEMI